MRTSTRLLTAAAILTAGLLVVGAGLRAQGSAVTRGPYLQRGSASSVVVRWRTAGATDSVVRYGTTPGQLTSTAALVTSTTEHEVVLSGLAPHTRYFYAVGTTAGVLTGGDLSASFTTAPATGTRVPTRLWVLGDAGRGDANSRAVRDAFLATARDREADLVLMLGDNAYPNGTDADYQAGVFDMFAETLRRTVLWPTLGNHDATVADSPAGTGPYYDIFSLPRGGESGGVPSGTEAYYSFDYGTLHIVCLDSSDSDRSPSGPMATWLRADLAANRADWTIAFFHHAPYSKGSHDSDTERELRDMRENLVPILEAGGVDLVLAGHSHSYERSFLLRGHYGPSTTLTPAQVLDSGPGLPDSGGYFKVQRGAGTVYVTAGASGEATPAPLNHPAMFRSVAELSSFVIDVDGLTMTLSAPAPGGNLDLVQFSAHPVAGRPGPPRDLTAHASDTTLRIDWEAPNAGGLPSQYVIEAGTAPGASDLGRYPTGSRATLTTTPPLAAGTYHLRVRAENANGLGPASNEVAVVAAPSYHTPPPPPANVRADVSGNAVHLQWDFLNPVWGLQSFLLEAGTAPGRRDIGTFPVSWRDVSFGGVPAGAYYVRVQTLAQGGLGVASPDVQIVVGGAPAVPGPPGQIRAAVSGRDVHLSWRPPLTGSPADRYVLEAGLTPGDFTAVRVPTGSARPDLVFAGVPPGTYYLRVRGENALGAGLPSVATRLDVP